MQIEKLPSEYLKETYTDKVFSHQKYGVLYDMFITTLLTLARYPINVLEIGISWRGEGSGHGFTRMPYVGKFVGVDSLPLFKPLPEPGKFIRGDAYSKDILWYLQSEGPFNLIIDDGRHTFESHQFILNNYPQFLATPGILVVEDIFDKDIEKYKKHFIDDRGMDVTFIRTPGEPLPSETNPPDPYICNLAVITQLSDKDPVSTSTNTQDYYSAIEKESKWLESLEARTFKQYERYNAIVRIFNNIATDSDYLLLKKWYYLIVKVRDSVPSDENLSKALYSVSIGRASSKEHKIVSEWYERMED